MAPFVRAALAADSSGSFDARIPLFIPADQAETDLEIFVSVPEGYIDENTDNDSRPFRYMPVDFGIVDLKQADFTDGGDTYDEYRVTGQLTGIPDGVEELDLDLSGSGATFVGSTGTSGVGCEYVTDTRARCGNLTPGSNDITLAINLPEEASAAVDVVLAVPGGYTDTNTTNDSDSTQLVPEDEVGHLNFDGPARASSTTENHEYLVRATLNGIRRSLFGFVTFTLVDPEDRFLASRTPICGIADDRKSMTCWAIVRWLPIDFRAKLTGASLGTLVAKQGEDTASTPVDPAETTP